MFIITNLGRKYIPAKHRLAPGQKSTQTATGRLWSSWGKGEIATDNPDFNKSDQVRIIRKRVGRNARIQIIIGTKVPYAKKVNDGRPDGQGRTAYGFAEKASQEAAILAKDVLEERITPILETGNVTTGARKRFNSAKQKRSLLGRFATGRVS